MSTLWDSRKEKKKTLKWKLKIRVSKLHVCWYKREAITCSGLLHCILIHYRRPAPDLRRSRGELEPVQHNKNIIRGTNVTGKQLLSGCRSCAARAREQSGDAIQVSPLGKVNRISQRQKQCLWGMWSLPLPVHPSPRRIHGLSASQRASVSRRTGSASCPLGVRGRCRCLCCSTLSACLFTVRPTEQLFWKSQRCARLHRSLPLTSSPVWPDNLRVCAKLKGAVDDASASQSVGVALTLASLFHPTGPHS